MERENESIRFLLAAFLVQIVKHISAGICPLARIKVCLYKAMVSKVTYGMYKKTLVKLTAIFNDLLTLLAIEYRQFMNVKKMRNGVIMIIKR